MSEKLPPYVVNCLQAAGYDVPEVIAEMDISDGPNNSIKVIENFIEKRYPGNPDYFCFHSSSIPSSKTLPFEFPPGHRVRIHNFVREVRKQKSKAVNIRTENRQKKSSLPGCKRQKLSKCEVDTSGNESECEVSVHSITTQVRRSISKWIKAQQDVRLQNLSENNHFSIVVARVAKSNHTFSVHVSCLKCKSCVHLHQKDKSNKSDPFLISNWTRHVKKCDKSKQASFKQSSMLAFACSTPNSLSDSSIVLSDSIFDSSITLTGIQSPPCPQDNLTAAVTPPTRETPQVCLHSQDTPDPTAAGTLPTGSITETPQVCLQLQETPTTAGTPPTGSITETPQVCLQLQETSTAAGIYTSHWFYYRNSSGLSATSRNSDNSWYTSHWIYYRNSSGLSATSRNSDSSWYTSHRIYYRNSSGLSATSRNSDNSWYTSHRIYYRNSSGLSATSRNSDSSWYTSH